MKKAFLSLAMGGFGIGMTEFVIMGILPEVAADLKITIPQAGHFISAYALGVVVGAPLLTASGSKWPAHNVLMALMGWFIIFNTASSFANSYNSMLILRFLSGLPHGAFFGIGAVVAGKLSKPGKEAQGIANMFTGLTVANVIGVPMGTWLGQNYSWGMAFLFVGVVGVLTFIAILHWMPELEPSSSKGLMQDMKVFKRPQLWLVFALTTIGTGGFFAWYSYIAPLITEVAGHNQSIVSYAMILAGIGMTIGNFVGAKMTEKLTPLYATMFALVFMATALVTNTFLAHDKVGVLVMTFVIGVIAFCLSAPLQLMMINSSKESQMLGSSLNQSAFNIGNAAGAYFAGLPIAFGYGFTSADLVGAGLACAGIVIATGILFYRKRVLNMAVPKT
ncbi:MFS transporter [Aliifodinibius sp. S!AR15-10]|uniref:MFS transporter n=1 Tax=Aliifodinibius sp. S!AR15-10 TaxID=2950437 RepID=UPI002863979F|nr:MFS transporter [Aliifodinibius sp. S!AR15-10]MDR8394332.1 MFS transporter [Aliifodinibius sp. S!AR15-10]